MLLHTVRKICTPRALNVAGLRRTVDVVANRRGIKLVLGWLVHIAMEDGMTRVRLGVSRHTGKPWMKFFGPRWYSEPVWWDMVPPEAYCYPVMLQVCLSLAELEECLPIKGAIPAIKQGKRLRLELEVDELDSFQIAWDPEYSSDRRTAEKSSPEERQTNARGGDGNAAHPG